MLAKSSAQSPEKREDSDEVHAELWASPVSSRTLLGMYRAVGVVAGGTAVAQAACPREHVWTAGSCWLQPGVAELAFLGTKRRAALPDNVSSWSSAEAAAASVIRVSKVGYEGQTCPTATRSPSVSCFPSPTSRGESGWVTSRKGKLRMGWRCGSGTSFGKRDLQGIVGEMAH